MITSCFERSKVFVKNIDDYNENVKKSSAEPQFNQILIEVESLSDT